MLGIVCGFRHADSEFGDFAIDAKKREKKSAGALAVAGEKWGNVGAEFFLPASTHALANRSARQERHWRDRAHGEAAAKAAPALCPRPVPNAIGFRVRNVL